MTTNHEHLREVAQRNLDTGGNRALYSHRDILDILDELAALRKENEGLRWLPPEPCPTEAPCHFSNAEANCWADGYNSCLLTIEQHRESIDSA
jgi:hypothetical protein